MEQFFQILVGSFSGETYKMKVNEINYSPHPSSCSDPHGLPLLLPILAYPSPYLVQMVYSVAAKLGSDTQVDYLGANSLPCSLCKRIPTDW